MNIKKHLQSYKMKKIALTLISCSLIWNCFSQTSIWKVSKNSSELYLGGSIHILRANDYPLPVEYDKAFENADKIVFETDIEQLENPQIAQTFMQKGMLKDNKTLQDVLSADVYEELKLEASKVSLPIENMARFKPSMVILTLTVMKIQQLGISADGVDKFYSTKSKENNKKMAFLETVDEQIELLVNMGDGKEDEFVKYSLKDFKNMEKDLDKLISTWRDGNSKVMKKQLKEMKSDFPDIYNSLLVNRNNNWTPQIEDYLTDEMVEFVVVGTLHLHGPDGLLNILKKKGYNIEQFKL